MRPGMLAGLSVAVLTIMPAQAAQAAKVTFDRPCYSPGEAITQIGSGFNPGSAVSETLSLLAPESQQVLGVLNAPLLMTDAQGAFMRRLPAPPLARDFDRTEIALSAFADQSDPDGNSVFLGWTLSAWDLEIAAWRRGIANPRGRMVIDTYGWTSAGSTLYAHYYRGLKLVRGVRIGALTGKCGDLRKQVKQFPFRNVKAGRWFVYFTGTRVHNRRADTSIRFAVRVQK